MFEKILFGISATMIAHSWPGLVPIPIAAMILFDLIDRNNSHRPARLRPLDIDTRN